LTRKKSPFRLINGQQTGVSIVHSVLVKNPGLTNGELVNALSRVRNWKQDNSSLHGRLRDLVASGYVLRGSKRICTKAKDGKRKLSFTYWPTMLVPGSNGMLSSQSRVSEELFECIDQMHQLVIKPSIQVPISVLRQKICWLHERIALREPQEIL